MPPPNKQLQRTVTRRHGGGARAPFHYALARASRGSARPLNCGVRRLIMRHSRREFVVFTGGLGAVLALAGCASQIEGETLMYGLIGRVRAVPGQRAALISILLNGVSGMPGCLSYVVAQDPSDADAIWITEVWDSAESHKASLLLPSVKEAISRGRPLIAGFDQHIETIPVGGHGFRADA